MLIILLTMSLVSFSQTGTDTKDSTVVIQSKVARLIIKDLISYDATKLELKVTQEILLNTENKVANQSLIIKQYEIKDGQWKQMVTNYDAQVLAYKNMTNDLQNDLRKSKLKGFYNKFGLSVVIGGLTYLYITK
jgi:hypothetical protein